MTYLGTTMYSIKTMPIAARMTAEIDITIEVITPLDEERPFKRNKIYAIDIYLYLLEVTDRSLRLVLDKFSDLISNDPFATSNVVICLQILFTTPSQLAQMLYLVNGINRLKTIAGWLI
jgi:hypothetical protein